LGKDGEKDRRQDSDDGDHNEQLNEGEARPEWSLTTHDRSPLPKSTTIRWFGGGGSISFASGEEIPGHRAHTILAIQRRHL
jgi:hypothetical protein